MPTIIDHDQRRSELAEIVADIIVKSGLEAVTIRSVAAAAGFSTAIVSHYFHSKRELLFYSYQRAEMRATARLEAAAAGSDGDVLRVLESLLPLTPAARRDWMVWAVFWGAAIADAEFSAEQKAQFRKARRRFERLLCGAAATDGARTLRTQADARRLLTVLIGIVVQAAFDPEDWPARRQRAYLAAALGIPCETG
jgi:AcrR family transcriptional regulator